MLSQSNNNMVNKSKRQASKKRSTRMRNAVKVNQRQGPAVPRGLPQNYPRAMGDEMRCNFSSTIIASVPSGDFEVKKLLVLGNGTDATGYSFLNSISALFDANAGVYSRWMLEELTVEVRTTGIGPTSNSFIAASYVPTNSSAENPPEDILEVSQSNHYCEATLGTTGRFKVRPCEFFNDWKNCRDTDDSDAQAGVIQVYGFSGTAESAVLAGVITLSGVLHFCGLRKSV